MNVLLYAHVRILATHETIVSWRISFVGFAVYHDAAFPATSSLLLGKRGPNNIARQRAAPHAPFHIQRERNLITLAGCPAPDKFFHPTCQLCKIFETSRSLITVDSAEPSSNCHNCGKMMLHRFLRRTFFLSFFFSFNFSTRFEVRNGQSGERVSFSIQRRKVVPL